MTIAKHSYQTDDGPKWKRTMKLPKGYSPAGYAKALESEHSFVDQPQSKPPESAMTGTPEVFWYDVFIDEGMDRKIRAAVYQGLTAREICKYYDLDEGPVRLIGNDYLTRHPEIDGKAFRSKTQKQRLPPTTILGRSEVSTQDTESYSVPEA